MSSKTQRKQISEKSPHMWGSYHITEGFGDIADKMETSESRMVSEMGFCYTEPLHSRASGSQGANC